MSVKNPTTVPHYYSERLKRKLAQLSDSPAAIVEAPSGFGKTTAVKDYLDASVSDDIDIQWFTAMDEASSISYQRLCSCLEKIDSKVGQRLQEIGFPNAFTLGEICELLRRIQCDHEAWLVIDNFQYLAADLPSALLTAFLDHGGAGLHVVILTQMLSREFHAPLTGRGFLYLKSSDLRLEVEDIRRYFTRAGRDLTTKQAEQVFQYTDGWIIAVFLQLCILEETGSFSDTAILSMMEEIIWDRLTREQQQFFLWLSPFETVTVRQMCAILGCDTLPDYAVDALEIPFIRYEPKAQRYELHSILSSLLSLKSTERGRAFEYECQLRAGDYYRGEGKPLEALKCYVKTDDYDQILSLDLSPALFEDIGSVPFYHLAQDIVERCPTHIRKRYPLSLLQIAWVLKSSGIDGAFESLMSELDAVLPAGGTLRAEWFLLSAYQYFPQTSDMLSCLEQAEPLFGHTCSKVILPEAPWCAGDHSQLAEFHIQTGEAENEALALEAFLALYTKLTNGHGSGADALFRAELAYYRGDMVDAEILAHRALAKAVNNRQVIIQLGATRILAEIALPKADTFGWQQAIAAMELAASLSKQNTLTTRSVLDTLHGILLVELEDHEGIAEWLKQGDFLDRLPPGPVATNGITVHTLYLLQRGDFARLIGTLQAVPPEIGEKTVFSELLICLFLSIAYTLMGDRKQGLAYLQKAAEKGLPDGMILPFVTASLALQGLVEELFANDYPHYLKDYERVKTQYFQGWDALQKSLVEASLPESLTDREYEVAQLAAEGLRNVEIARKLSVSENTVRAHLRTIFQKLNVDRRAKLAERMQQIY